MAQIIRYVRRLFSGRAQRGALDPQFEAQLRKIDIQRRQPKAEARPAGPVFKTPPEPQEV